MSIKVLQSGGSKKIEMEEKTVTASTSAVIVLPTEGKAISKVTVNPTPTEEKTEMPGVQDKTVTPSEGKHLSKVVIKGDDNLIPENIAKGISIFGVDGIYGGIPIEYTFTGQHQVSYDRVDKDGGSYFEYTLKLLSSGILNVKRLVTPFNDVYVIGGGGGGGGGTGYSSTGGGGGGGGHLSKSENVAIPLNEDLEIIIANGGAGAPSGVEVSKNGTAGGQSSAFGITANGGGFGMKGHGGSGGSGGGAGMGTPNTSASSYIGGAGDGQTKDVLGTLYCAGGGGGGRNSGNPAGNGGSNGSNGGNTGTGSGLGGATGGGNGGTANQVGSNGSPNSGGGGGGGGQYSGGVSFSSVGGGAGGSGIVIIKGRFA